jgi:hypothetical protein
MNSRSVFKQLVCNDKNNLSFCQKEIKNREIKIVAANINEVKSDLGERGAGKSVQQ